MATFTDTIQILIKADGAKAVGELKKVGGAAERELDKADKATRNWSASFTRAGVGLTTFAAVAGAGLYRMAQSADEAKQAQLRLDNTIANSPQLTEKSARAFRDLADALMRKTVVDDDAVISAEALLGQMGLQESQILSLTPLVVDLSRKMGVDLDTAAKAVGKAVNGSGTALNKMGVQVKAGADGVVDFTDVMDALSSKVGGFAESEAKTFSGQVEQMKVQLGEVAEGIGGGVLPMFETLLGPVSAVSEMFASLSPETQALVGQFAGLVTGAAGIVGVFGLVAGQASKVRDSLTVMGDDGVRSLNGLGKAAALTTVIGGLVTLAATIKDIVWADAVPEDQLRGNINEFAATLLDGVGSLNEVQRALDAVDKQVSEFITNIGIVGSENTGFVFFEYFPEGLKGVSKALTGTTADFGKYIEGLHELTDNNQQYNDVIDDVSGSLEDMRSAMSRNAQQSLNALLATGEITTAQYESAVAAGEQADATIDYVTALKSVPGIQRESEIAIEKHTRALQLLIEQTDRYQDRLKGNRDSSRDAALAQLDAADAVQQVADAQKSYNDTVAQYGEGSAEAAAAQRELQRAIIGASQAQDDATQAVLDNAAAQAGYDRGAENNIKKTQRYVTELVKARNELSGPTRAAVDAHIAKILGIPVERVTRMTLPEIQARMRELREHRDEIERVPQRRDTRVTASGAAQAEREVRGVRNEIDGLRDRSVTVTVTTVVDFANELGRRIAASLGFEKGGRIPAGRVSIVGEAGPELLVDGASKRTRVIGADGPELIRPTSPGFVIPNDKIQMGDGRRLRAGMLDNARLDATFVHNGPVDASTTAVLYGDDQVMLERGRQARRGLLGRLAGRRAAGGPVSGGEAYLVGEAGPEVVMPERSGRVLSNQQLRQMYRTPQPPAPSGDVIVVNFHGPVASQRQAEDWVVSALASARRRGNRLAS